MNDDNRDRRDDSYLWDGTGVPDPDVVGLEKTLGVLRHRGRPPELPDRPAVPARRAAGRAGGGWPPPPRWSSPPAPDGWRWRWRSSTWSVNSVAGAPAIGDRAVVTQARLKQGEWLVTDNQSRARIAVGGIGNVDVEPNTRVQLVAGGTRAPDGARPRHHPRAYLGAAETVLRQHPGGAWPSISAAPTRCRSTSRARACCA